MTDLREDGLAILRRAVGSAKAEFHDGQWEAIAAAVENRERSLVVQRTGWGKSAVYFIATRLLRDRGAGPTIVMSPLLALMRNQTDAAAKFGVRLGAINSANTPEENEDCKKALIDGQLDAVIVAPEQLAKSEVREEVLGRLTGNIGLLVVDEAHCISDWGHDFRPDYKRIRSLIANLPVNVPVIATTATANQRVMEDVVAQLGDEIALYRGPLARDTLRLQNLWFPRRSQRLAWLADTLPGLQGSGIIYTATTRDAEMLADWLKFRGIQVEAYYGSLRGLTAAQNTRRRIKLEEALLQNRIKALVATSALGMGFDKPDLAFVIHFQSPGSVVSYYQQVGRAGRAIAEARGILLSGSEDDEIQRYFIDNAFPPKWIVEKILDLLVRAGDGLSLGQLEGAINARKGKVEAALRFLSAESPAPILARRNGTIRYVRTLTDYELPVEVIARLGALRVSEWETMQAYLAHQGCLMRFLAAELDDPHQVPCGKCANCCAETAVSVDYSHETGVAAAEFLENVLIEIPPRIMAGTGKTDVEAKFPVYQFPVYFRNEGLQHEPGRALCRWGEAGWGEVAMRGKREGCFDERLVRASARLIRERWKPDPAPRWIAFVPSHDHLGLVPHFAQQLARELGLPCRAVINKVKRNQPQKTRENAFHRCINLDGVFEIVPELSEGPVLLVDDAVDSGWTFAVIAALLRRAGSGPVIPFAVMSTSGH